MTGARKAAWTAFAVAIAGGTITDRTVPRAPVVLGGYRVLAADFHVHPFPLSGGILAPWDLAVEAQRQGLDVIAMTPHNSVLVGQAPAWLGGAMVIPGEEVRSSSYHLIAVGVHDYISWRFQASTAIDEVHRQGGAAIAAHPTSRSWGAYDLTTERMLDGAEVRHPMVYGVRGAEAELEEFYRRVPVAAIGSSDYHGQGPMGACRTYVVAREASIPGVLDAVRAHRTVVVDGGHVYGDPALVRYANELPAAPAPPARWPAALGLAALTCLLLGERLHQVV